MSTSRHTATVNETLVGELLGSPVVSRRKATGGYTPAERWVVELADGRSAFVKVAVNELTAEWLRKEIRVYADVRAAVHGQAARIGR